jgi:hypothetical protein
MLGRWWTPIVLVRLQKTPLYLLHCFIYDSTGRHYNLSSYTEFLPSDILPRSGSLMSSVFRRLAADSGWLLVTELTIRDWLLVVEIHLLKQIISWPNIAHLVSWSYLPSQQSRCLGNITANSIRRHGDVLSFRGNTLILSLTIRCSGNMLPFCVAQAMDFSIPAFTRGLPSRCLVMDFSISVSCVFERKTVAWERRNPYPAVV